MFAVTSAPALHGPIRDLQKRLSYVPPCPVHVIQLRDYNVGDLDAAGALG